MMKLDLSNNEAVREFSRGGLVLSAAFIGVGCGLSSLSFYTTGVFMVPWQEEFGWSRSAISGTGVFAVVVLAVLSPMIGMLNDRIGIKLVGAVSLGLFAVCLFGLSFLFDSILVLYAAYIVTAFLAAGSTPVTFTRAVTGWFDVSRGLALGIALLGAGVAGVLAPLLLTQAVEAYGWRSAYRFLAIIVLFAAVYVFFFLKEDPDDTGTAHSTPSEPSDSSLGIDASDAYKTNEFLLMGTIFLLVALSVSGLIVHFIPMMTDLGMTQSDAGQLAAVIGVSIMVGRVGAGILIDRYFAPHVAAALFGAAALGYLIFVLGGANFALVAAIAVGLSMGAEVDLIGYMVSRYFGLKAYGVLYGGLYSVFLVGAAVSPLLAGLAFDLSGDYQIFLIGSSAALALAAYLSLSLGPFPKFGKGSDSSVQTQLLGAKK